GRVLAEGDDFASRGGINHVWVRGGHFPLGHDIAIRLRRARGSGIRWSSAQRFALIRVQRAEAGARWVAKAGVERKTEETALVVGVGRVQRSGADGRDLDATFDIERRRR